MKYKTGKTLALALALGLMLCLGVCAYADNASVSTWSELQTALSNSGTVTLTQDVTADATDAALEVPSGGPVTLDLNGHTLDRGRSTAATTAATAACTSPAAARST